MSTTTDPVRLVADPGRPESERALLQLGADIAPPRDAEARVWLALVGAIGVPAAAGVADASTKTTTTTTATAAKAKVGLTGVKIAAVVVTLAALVALASYLVGAAKRPRPPVSVATAPATGTPTQPAAVPAATPPPSEEAPPPEEAAPARPAPGTRRAVRELRPRTSAGPTTTSSSPATRLREETTLIRDARQALRAGDAARALRVLDECRRLFPAGVLQQERERLTIEGLMKDGRAAEASARAAAFLRKYPDSPHAGEIRALNLGTSGR